MEFAKKFYGDDSKYSLDKNSKVCAIKYLKQDDPEPSIAEWLFNPLRIKGVLSFSICKLN